MGLSPTAAAEGTGDTAEMPQMLLGPPCAQSSARPKAGARGQSCRQDTLVPAATLQPGQLGKLGRASSVLGVQEGAGGEREVYWRGRDALTERTVLPGGTQRGERCCQAPGVKTVSSRGWGGTVTQLVLTPPPPLPGR